MNAAQAAQNMQSLVPVVESDKMQEALAQAGAMAM